MIKDSISNLVVTLLFVAVIAGLTACDADPVELKGGKLPDKDGLENTYGMLCSRKTSEKWIDVLLAEGYGAAAEMCYFRQTQPVSEDTSLELRIDNSLIEAYNAAEGIDRLPLPEANVDFPDGKILAISKDQKRSAELGIKFSASNLEPGEYVLPLTVAAADAPDRNKTLYYNITVRRPQMGDYDLHDGHTLFFVFYINTSQYQPLLVDEYFMQRDLARGVGEDAWYNVVGNIINLRTVKLDYEATTGRAMLNLGADMRYVLDHYTKYISPLQDKGRKVCISIEGGGKGLGFCNLSDAQIDDFAAQVKAVIMEYGLDGVNLWDRNAGYGTKEGMPAVNTTSYPKLIKALREALGAEKMLTVTVYGEPTETFYDTQATGGIAVGDYIDYAWSGYNNNEESPQLLDPWHPELEYVSAYTQKPIANLPKERYGCINFPIYSGATMNNAGEDKVQYLFDWVGQYKPNNIVVFDDLRTVLQDGYETYWDMMFGECCAYIDDESYYYLGFRKGYSYVLDVNRALTILPDGKGGYGKWLKDW